MKHSGRNIPDPISPQNPVNKTDITNDHIQTHPEEKASMDDIFLDENELANHQSDLENKNQSTMADDISLEDEAGL